MFLQLNLVEGSRHGSRLKILLNQKFCFSQKEYDVYSQIIMII